MTKKLLLTTALVSALSATTANATDYIIAYTGNNTFTINNTPYASFATLNTAMEALTDNLTAADKVTVRQNSGKAFLTDLISNNALQRELIAVIAADGELDAGEVTQGFNELLAGLSTLSSSERDLYLNAGGFALDNIGVGDEDGLSDNLKEIFSQFQYLQQGGDPANVIALLETESRTNAKFVTIETAVAQDSNVSQLIEQRNELRKLKTLTTEQAAKLDSLSKQVASLKEFVEARNSKETQENLKQHITKIEKQAAGNKTSKTQSLAELNELKRDIDRYVVRDVKDATKVPNVQKSDSALSEGLMNSLVISRGVVDSRIGGFSAVSAGDLMQTYGVWAQGSLSRGTQKAHGNAPGYKLDQKGVTIGADTGDETLLGVAYSFFVNDIKNKDNASNKEDVKSHIVTIYGKFDVTNEVFVSGQGQYGKSNIKKKRATGDLANNIASAKTKADSMAAKLEAGYDYEVAPQIHLVPTVGASYANIQVKGYKESGKGLNRSVAKRTTNRTSGLAGITAKYVADMGGSMKVIPEIHANVDYAFNTKNSATSVTLVNGIDAIATPAQKISKGFYNIGGSVKGIQADMYEISAGYDLGLAKKFQSHTGTLKLKVNL